MALIYKVHLLIVECKSGEKDAFTSETLDRLTSVATPLGGRFASKILVASLLIPDGTDREKDRTFESFKDKAESRSVFVATREDLPDTGELLRKQAIRPTYPRI